MDAPRAALALQSLLILTLFGWLWFSLWPALVVEIARQNFFAIRDRLFIIAVKQENGITLSSPAYQKLRRKLNAMINAADCLNLWGALALLAKNFIFESNPLRTEPDEDPGFGLNEDGRIQLTAIDREIRLATVKFLVLRTPLLSAIFSLCVLLGISLYTTYRVVRTLKGKNLVKLILIHAKQRLSREVDTVVEQTDQYEDIAVWSKKHAPRMYRPSHSAVLR